MGGPIKNVNNQISNLYVLFVSLVTRIKLNKTGLQPVSRPVEHIFGAPRIFTGRIVSDRKFAEFEVCPNKA